MRRRNVGAYRVARVLLPPLTVHVGSGVANAQSPALVTDRPDRSESAAVILKGMVQVETGYLFASNSNVSRYEAPGTLFRIGLGGQTELRIGPAGITGEEGKHGAGDGNLGVKVNLIERTNGWRQSLQFLVDCRSRPEMMGFRVTAFTRRSWSYSPTNSRRGCPLAQMLG